MRRLMRIPQQPITKHNSSSEGSVWRRGGLSQRHGEVSKEVSDNLYRRWSVSSTLHNHHHNSSPRQVSKVKND